MVMFLGLDFRSVLKVTVFCNLFRIFPSNVEGKEQQLQPPEYKRHQGNRTSCGETTFAVFGNEETEGLSDPEKIGDTVSSCGSGSWKAKEFC